MHLHIFITFNAKRNLQTKTNATLHILAHLVKQYNVVAIKVVKIMHGFEVDTSEAKSKSVNRTIRFKNELYDKLMDLSEETDVSFNNLVNQCVAYALDSMKDKKG